jgi:hypothetical protein
VTPIEKLEIIIGSFIHHFVVIECLSQDLIFTKSFQILPDIQCTAFQLKLKYNKMQYVSYLKSKPSIIGHLYKVSNS